MSDDDPLSLAHEAEGSAAAHRTAFAIGRRRDKGTRARHRGSEDQRHMYNPATDISISFLGSDTTIEVKRRATGFAQLYDWLNDRDVLIGKADRQEPLVVPCVSLAAESAKAGNEVA
jgi:hypothetical protein